MEEKFVNLIVDNMDLVRKRGYRQLGSSHLAEILKPILIKNLTEDIANCSPVQIGDVIVEIIIRGIESLAPEGCEIDNPRYRQYKLLHDFFVLGKEWKLISDELFITKSTFYEIKKVALDSLAYAIWRRVEAEMNRKILNNLPKSSYTIFTEVYSKNNKEYVNEEIIERLKIYQGLTYALCGEPGVGKSSIVREVGERIVNNPNKYNLPFEAVIWLSCRQDIFELEPKQKFVVSVLDSMAKVYEEIGRTLNNLSVLQGSIDEKRTIVEKLLKNTVCLFIVDNLDSEWTPEKFQNDLLDFIRDLPRPHMTLITMRPEKLFFQGIRLIKIEPMGKEIARKFINDVANDRGVTPFTEYEFDRVYDKTHGIPIAMKLVLGLTRGGTHSLNEALNFGDYNRDILGIWFEKAYQSLPDYAKKVLLTIRLFGNKAPAEGIALASGITGPERVDAITRLYRSYMIEKNIQNWTQEPVYTLLPFFSEYLREKKFNFKEENIVGWADKNFLSEVCQNIAKYYLKLLEAGKDRRDNGLLLLKEEGQNIQNIMDWCWEHEELIFIDILDLIGPLLGTHRLLDDRILWGDRAAELLTKHKNLEKASWYRIRDVAWAQLAKGTTKSREEGKRILENEYELSISHNWIKNKALAMRNLAKLLIEEGKNKDAEEMLLESMKIWEKNGDLYWSNITMHRIADLKVQQGHFSDAINEYELIEHEYQQISYKDGVIEAMISRGSTLVKNNQYEEGMHVLENAINEAEFINKPAYVFGLAKKALAEIYESRNEFNKAITAAEMARNTFDALGMKYLVDQLDAWINDLSIYLKNQDVYEK